MRSIQQYWCKGTDERQTRPVVLMYLVVQRPRYQPTLPAATQHELQFVMVDVLVRRAG